MPSPFKPKWSSAHRIACLALYRALLRQCPRIILPPETPKEPAYSLKDLTRKQFRRHEHLQSTRLIVSAIEHGYKAEELLRTAAEGDLTSYSKIVDFVSAIRAQREASRASSELNQAPPLARKRKPEPYPGAEPVLKSRPRPLWQLSGGRRHVPTVTHTSMQTFLRFKKPQSPFLSRVLNDTIKQRQKRLDTIDQMTKMREWAVAEDQWDELIGSEVMGEESDDSVSWTKALDQAGSYIQWLLVQQRKRATNIGTQLLDIADRELALAKEEQK